MFGRILAHAVRRNVPTSRLGLSHAPGGSPSRLCSLSFLLTTAATRREWLLGSGTGGPRPDGQAAAGRERSAPHAARVTPEDERKSHEKNVTLPTTAAPTRLCQDHLSVSRLPLRPLGDEGTGFWSRLRRFSQPCALPRTPRMRIRSTRSETVPPVATSHWSSMWKPRFGWKWLRKEKVGVPA